MSEVEDIRGGLKRVGQDARQYGHDALNAVREDSPFETLIERYRQVGEAALTLMRATNVLEIHRVRMMQDLISQYGTDGTAITVIKERLSAVTQGSDDEHLAETGDYISRLPEGFMRIVRRMTVLHEQLGLTDVRIWMTEFAERADDVGSQVGASVEENRYLINKGLRGLQASINAWTAEH